MNTGHAVDLTELSQTRFSGHETFACRYAWLPKAYAALVQDPATFSDEEAAMVELGIGKNMVRSLRFWVEAMGIAESRRGSRSLHPTKFGAEILSADGYDPYLEDQRTLWLLHWKLASRRDGALFAWRFLIGHWPYSEFSRSEALRESKQVCATMGLGHSEVTLAQHIDVFLHTYYPTRSSHGGPEDSLDGPLVDLELLIPLGERQGDTSRWELVYGFRRDPKPEITQTLFDYCLRDFWDRFAPNEDTMTMRTAALGSCSPGQVFKLVEDDLRARFEAPAAGRAPRGFTFQPSAIQGLLFKTGPGPTLKDVYARQNA